MVNFKRLKRGSLVTCKDENDLKKTIKALSDAGFGAAQCAKYRIYITRLPSPEERKD
jgi:hypothetical protein